MKQDNKQESSLKKTIDILAEMTRKDIERLDNTEDFLDLDIESTHPYQKTPVPHPA